MILSKKSIIFVLLFLAASLENGDEVLVPSVYKAIGDSLDISVEQLSSLTFGRSLLQTIFSLVIAPIIDFLHRYKVLGLSCLAWGVSTIIVGWSHHYYLLFSFRATTGICLAFAVPTLRSLMSTISSKQHRAKGFSLLYFGSNTGALFWGIFATSTGDKDIPLFQSTVKGWRLVFTVFAILSMGVGFLLYMLGKSEDAGTDQGTDETNDKRTMKSHFMEYYYSAKIVLRKKTFLLIALQGVIGSMPWKAFSFLPLILQRAEFSGEQAAIIVGCFQVGVTFGVLLGGWIADILSAKLPDKGYILTAQLSAGSQLPLSYMCLMHFPFEEAYFYHLSFAFFCFGLFISWCGSVNNSMFSEICPEHMRNAVYALNYAVEGSISSAIIPIIGFFSDTEAEITNAGDPLAINVYRICVAASLWLLLVYSLLYKPYREEKRQLRHTIPSYSNIGGSKDHNSDEEHGTRLEETEMRLIKE